MNLDTTSKAKRTSLRLRWVVWVLDVEREATLMGRHNNQIVLELSVNERVEYVDNREDDVRESNIATIGTSLSELESGQW